MPHTPGWLTLHYRVVHSSAIILNTDNAKAGTDI